MPTITYIYQMKYLLLPVVLLLSCSTSQKPAAPIVGSWQLFYAATITRGDTSLMDIAKGTRMIKIINDTHFAFLRHEPDVDTVPGLFDGGGGRYTLKDNTYTEYLDFYKDRDWEGKSLTFTVNISNDTLVQKGMEKVEAENIDREIIEKYVRVK